MGLGYCVRIANNRGANTHRTITRKREEGKKRSDVIRYDDGTVPRKERHNPRRRDEATTIYDTIQRKAQEWEL